MKIPKINWTMVLAVVVGLVIFFAAKKWLFADKVDVDSMELISEFRGWKNEPYMRRAA